MKKCPACAKQFVKGRRALVSDRMRLVCLTCSSKALRVVTTIATTKCVEKRCNGTASICATCASSSRAEALEAPLAPVRSQLEAMIRALALVKQREQGEGLEEYVRGKLEGLETALTVVLIAQEPK
jgi:hypothetical protein